MVGWLPTFASDKFGDAVDWITSPLPRAVEHVENAIEYIPNTFSIIPDLHL